MGSALLSALLPSPWVSVIFALTVMGVVSFLRFRVASDRKDSSALEACSEEVYLLGYLLTLASLVGLAPRLMSDDSNLFHIAGVKLITTIFGLGVMMIFRQMARRWAEEGNPDEADRFAEQEQQFRAAVGRLNSSAEQLTGKMEEVTLRFDPDLLRPVAEWSNRAANAFSEATRAFESVPKATAPSVQGLRELNDDLSRVKSALSGLTNLLTGDLGAASVGLGRELGQAGNAARMLGTAVNALQPAAEAGRIALETLGTQALKEVDRLGHVNLALGQIANELIKVEDALKHLASDAPADIAAPINQLVQALATASAQTVSCSSRMDALSGNLQGAALASNELGIRLAGDFGVPIVAHGVALGRVDDQLQGATRQIERLAQTLDSSIPRQAESARHITSELVSLRHEMGETNRQLQLLIGKIGERTSESLGRDPVVESTEIPNDGGAR